MLHDKGTQIFVHREDGRNVTRSNAHFKNMPFKSEEGVMSENENNKARDDSNQAQVKFERGVVTKQQGVPWTKSPSVSISPNTLGRSGEELQSAQGSRCIPKREVLKMSAGTGHVTGGS